MSRTDSVTGDEVRESASICSERPSAAARLVKNTLGDSILCCGCRLSGNGVSMLTSAFLFALITAVQFFFANLVGSTALKADCISMAVDSLSFLGNLFADCYPKDSPQKRRVELGMSGISHGLLLGFTVQFVLDAVSDSQVTHDDDSESERNFMGWVVLGFAIGGLTFDIISLAAYKYFGTRSEVDEEGNSPDALTCGINTNMCAALLHILSDLGRSTTTFIEGIVLLTVQTIPATQADGISTLVVCSIIAIGASAALLAWMREVYLYISGEHIDTGIVEADDVRDSINPIRKSHTEFSEKSRADSLSGRAENVAASVSAAVGETYSCLCLKFSGNGVSLLTSAFLFGLITAVQYGFAKEVNSKALEADCVSMGVDSLSFVGNLFADMYPKNSAQKRRIELGMSGMSHFLLLGFTISFIVGAISDSQVTHDDDSEYDRKYMGWVVFGFALGGLTFDIISLLAYKIYGSRSENADATLSPDALTCGINTNMCAALLHILSDLGRSTTTFIEGIVLLTVQTIPATQADGISTLVVCSIIVIGASAAVLTWMREVYLYITRGVGQQPIDDAYRPLNVN